MKQTSRFVTIERYKLDGAKGLVIIFNAYNLLHCRPEDFKQLLVNVLLKTKDGERRFPYIHAAIYFSFETVKTADGKSFWAAMQFATNPNEDVTPMEQFQKEVQQAWYRYVQQKTGRVVRQFSGD